jgi:hypothetical protein
MIVSERTFQIVEAGCIFPFTDLMRSRNSSVGITTRYGLEGPGIEFRWREIFRTYPRRLRSPPRPLYNGYRVFPGGKGGQCVKLTSPHLRAECNEIWEPKTPGTHWATPRLLRDLFAFYIEQYIQYPTNQVTMHESLASSAINQALQSGQGRLLLQNPLTASKYSHNPLSSCC